MRQDRAAAAQLDQMTGDTFPNVGVKISVLTKQQQKGPFVVIVASVRHEFQDCVTCLFAAEKSEKIDFDLQK